MTADEAAGLIQRLAREKKLVGDRVQVEGPKPHPKVAGVTQTIFRVRYGEHTIVVWRNRAEGDAVNDLIYRYSIQVNDGKKEAADSHTSEVAKAAIALEEALSGKSELAGNSIIATRVLTAIDTALTSDALFATAWDIEGPYRTADGCDEVAFVNAFGSTLVTLAIRFSRADTSPLPTYRIAVESGITLATGESTDHTALLGSVVRRLFEARTVRIAAGEEKAVADVELALYDRTRQQANERTVE